MVITFKTFAKLIGVAVGTVAVIAVADKVIDKIADKIEDRYYAETEPNEGSIDLGKADIFKSKMRKCKTIYKAAVRAIIIMSAIAKVVSQAFRCGLEFGTCAGAGYAIRGNMAEDQLLAIIDDREAFHSFMSDIWKVVRV